MPKQVYVRYRFDIRVLRQLPVADEDSIKIILTCDSKPTET